MAEVCGNGARGGDERRRALRAEERRGKEEEGNERRGRELTSSLLFIPSGATAQSHNPLRMIGVDRGLTAPRSAT